MATTRMNPAANFYVYFSSDASLSRRKGFVRPFGGGRSFRNSVVRLQSRRYAPSLVDISRRSGTRTDFLFLFGIRKGRALSIPGVM